VTDDGDFLRRWSRRKIAAKTGEKVEAERPPAQPTPEAGRAPTAGAVPESSGTQLPPVESLTPESDFAPFMQTGVDPGVKREALKTLLRDPRFNVMDGLDVYIDDYSKPDPLPVGWLEKLNQMKHLGEYLEPAVGEAPEDPGQAAGEPGEAMQEQPVTFPEEGPPVDTAGKDPPAPD
jgi:hypothetical protein